MQKLLFFFAFICISVNSYCQESKEYAAIKKVLETESATWRSGDVKKHADCWAIRPYSRILISIGDSTVLDISPTVMIDPPANFIGQGGYSVNTNYKMSIYENNAWVSHDEESTDKDGKKTYSFEFRMLEKINGEWKLVAQSIHVYKHK